MAPTVPAACAALTLSSATAGVWAYVREAWWYDYTNQPEGVDAVA